MLDSSRHADAGNRAAGLLVDYLDSVVCSAPGLSCCLSVLQEVSMPAADRPSSGGPAGGNPDASAACTWFPVTSSCTTSSPSRLGHQD
jgi:hypothetical protein